MKDKIARLFISSVTCISPKLASKLVYKHHTGKKLNLKNPKLFNEKLMYLKLNNYNKNDLVVMCSDKINLEKYVKACGYKDLTNKIIKIYKNANEINFNELPKQLALKCNHGCKFNIIIPDKSKIDQEEVKKQLNKWLKTKYGYITAETHYFKIKPRIYAEEYIKSDKVLPNDYKVYCFNGKAKCILVCTNREKELEQLMVDTSWNKLDYLKEEVVTKDNISKPKHLKEMIEISEKLSKPFPFVRVDFYESNTKPILGELTFTPARCADNDYNEKGNIELGKMLDINEKK